MDWFLYDNGLRHEGVKKNSFTDIFHLFCLDFKNNVFHNLCQ